ncbi:MAG TPA: hypothetical protein P5163_00015 [Rubrivivax sp.]|nr:hypothetical protein [Rubrivivax sp.]
MNRKPHSKPAATKATKTLRPTRAYVAPVEPVYLGAQQTMSLLQLSERQFRALRTHPAFPVARQLGPRSARWHRDELLRFVDQHLPRVQVLEVPPQFAALGRQAEDKSKPGA